MPGAFAWGGVGRSRSIELAYGPDRARFKRIDENETGLTMTRTIAGGSYEVAITAAGTVTAKVYVGGAAGGESTCRRTLEPTASP